MRRSRNGSPPRRWARSQTCSTRPAGRSATSTCSRSTRPSPCVAMAPMKDLGIPHDKLNVNGGACALGHPDRRHRRAPGGDPDPCPAGHAAASVAWPRCASAAAKPPQSPSRWRERFNGRHLQKKLYNRLTARNGLVIMSPARNCALPIYNDEEINMTINKTLLALALGLALAACATRSRLLTPLPTLPTPLPKPRLLPTHAAATGDATAPSCPGCCRHRRRRCRRCCQRCRCRRCCCSDRRCCRRCCRHGRSCCRRGRPGQGRCGRSQEVISLRYRFKLS